MAKLSAKYLFLAAFVGFMTAGTVEAAKQKAVVQINDIEAYYGCIVGFTAIGLKKAPMIDNRANLAVDGAQHNCAKLYPKHITGAEQEALNSDLSSAITALLSIGAGK